jgi:hypothetical protein
MLRSVGAGGGQPPPATRWDGKRGVGHRPQATAPILDSTTSDINISFYGSEAGFRPINVLVLADTMLLPDHEGGP